MRRVFIAAALLAVAAPAFAQNPQKPVQENCIGQNGKAVACQLSDIPTNGDIIPNAKAIYGGNKGQVVFGGNGTPTSYPAGSTPVTGAATGTTSAVTGSLAATAGVTNYLCSFDVSAIGGSATIGPITVSNLAGGNTLTFQIASTASGNYLQRTFTPCIPAKAPNTAISVATTADGTATAVDVNLIGFQQ